MTNDFETQTHQEVQRYYGETLESSADLKTSACCTSATPTGAVRAVMAQIHPDVQKRYYGCGLILPEVLEGRRVLDLGCGAGRDVYLLSSLVGERGHVVGVDMTPAQLAVANAYRDYHAESFGHAASNVEFLQGNIERLDDLQLDDSSFDLIVSNCVINLAVDKAAVLRSVHRLLKPGGEMYFSDVYADRRIPAELAADPVLYGECLSGALYWRDFMQLAVDCGLAVPRLVEDEPLAVTEADVAAKIGDIRFCSATFRLFRLADVEPGAENYGQAAIYRGTVAGAPDLFVLDQDFCFPAGQKIPVCGNTYRLLKQSRLSEHFELFGDFSHHFGEFRRETMELAFDISAVSGHNASQSKGCC